MLSLFCSGHCLQELADYSMDMLSSWRLALTAQDA